MRKLMMTGLMLASLTTSVAAQPIRTPPAHSSSLFVEVAEPAAGDYQALFLQRTTIVGDNALKPDDVLIVAPSGAALIVRAVSHRFGPTLGVYVDPFGFFPECFQTVQLRPGVRWSVGNLDGDGRSDLIGHDKAKGEVVRVYQRGTGYACTY